MSIAVYFYDSNAKLTKQGSLTTTAAHTYTYSATEVDIQQGDIGSHTLAIVMPDAMFTAGDTGVFATFIAPNGNKLGLIPGTYQTSHITVAPAAEATYTNCILFSLDVAFYTYVAGRVAFAIGFVDSSTGSLKKTASGIYVVQNGTDNFTESNLTASDYDNLLTAITTLTAGFGADIDALEATALFVSNITGASGETPTQATKVPSVAKLTADISTGSTANSVIDQGYTDAEINKVKDGTYTAKKAEQDNHGNVIDDTYATKAAYTAELGAKADKSGGNNWLGIQSHYLTNGKYFKINDTNSDLEFIDTDTVVIWKLDSTGLYLNPAKLASVGSNYCPSKTLVDSYISTHNGTVAYIGSHPYILALIEALQQEIDRLNAIGKSWGEVNYTNAELTAMSSSALAIAIEADILGRYDFYVKALHDYVYDRGVVVDTVPTNYHVWKWNGTVWADEGIESAVGHASNDLFGLVKGDGVNTSITNGIITILLSSATYAVVDETTGLLHYTYEEIYALEGRIGASENDIADHETRIDTAEADIVNLESTLNANTLVNANEIYAQKEPYGTLTKALPTSTVAHKTANLNSIDIDGTTIKNYIKDGNFAQAVTHPNWSAVNAVLSYRQNAANVLATAQYGSIRQTFTTVIGHVYFVRAWMSGTITSNSIFISGIGATITALTVASGQWLSFNFTATGTSHIFTTSDARASGWTSYQIKDVLVLDLTELGTHSTGVHWHDMSAATVATYLGKYAFTGLTAGLHSNTPDELHANTLTPNTVELKRISGRTVKESLINPDFAAALAAADWVATDCGTPTVSGSKITLTATAQNGGISQTLTVVSGNKWYISALVKASSANVKLVGTNPTASAAHSGGGAFELLHFVVAASSTSIVVSLRDENASGWAAVECYWIQAFPLTGLGVAHLTTPAEVATYFSVSVSTLTCYPFGLTNSIPTAVVTSLASYAVAKSEWPTDQQTYGMPCLPCGVCDYIDGHTSNYWRNVGFGLYDGSGDTGTLAYVSSGTNTYLFTWSNFSANSLVATADTTTLLCNRFIQANGTSTDVESIWANGTTLYLRILKTRLTAGTDTALNTWLTTNTLQIQYYRTATDHALTSATISTFRVNSATTDTISITGALNPTTCFDLGDYYSHATDISSIGVLNSLPDGTKDNFHSAIDTVANSATFQQRITQRTNVAVKIDLPTTAGYWQLGKVGTTCTRFFIKLEDIYTAKVLNARATHVFRANLPTASGWSDFDTDTYSCPLTTGLETWADTVVPTIYLKGIPFGKALGKYEDYVLGTEGIYLDQTSENLIFLVADANDLAGLYAELATNPISVVIPYDTYGATVENAYVGNAGVLDDFIASTADSALCTFYYDVDNTDHYFSLKLANATADTLAELYTYLASNPISVVVPIVNDTTAVTTFYVPQSGDNDLTLATKSSTVALAGDWEMTYCKDATLLYGDSYDDLFFPMGRHYINPSNSKPDYDATNLCMLFPQNVTTEYVEIIAQIPHTWKEGTTIYPHVHCQQEVNAQAVMKMDYCWYNASGSAIPSWTTGYTMNIYTDTTAYATPRSNILYGAGIAGTGKTVSSIMKIKLYRDDNVYTGDLKVDHFDIHIICESIGSDFEFYK